VSQDRDDSFRVAAQRLARDFLVCPTKAGGEVAQAGRLLGQFQAPHVFATTPHRVDSFNHIIEMGLLLEEVRWRRF
jgi:hypothetical protein